ncbi:IPTL-CTERM sorting domain-containing protein [Zoogloea sp.]|uniref:IPTL-CTERM sorting domain-containing protein n=1 Tax=Zoogloea sp. TaxID=49181 RepID=UPI0031FCAA23
MRHTLRRSWSTAFAVAGLALSQAAFAAPPTLSCSSNASLLNTGYNSVTSGVLPNGSPDAQWEVSDMQPPTGVVQPPPATVNWGPAYVGNLVPGAWAASPFGNANWISREGANVDKTSPTGDWYYRYQFYLDPAVTPSSFALSMNFNSDNSVVEVYVNGVAQSGQTTGLPQPGGYYGTGYASAQAASTTLNHNWQTGLNTIVVQIQSGANFEGFMAQMAANAVCDSTPQINVSKTTPATSVVAGATIDYTIVVSNVGTAAASNVAVSDPLPAGISSATWSCTATGGAVCAASGSGGITDTITSLPAGSKATYTLHGVVSGAPPGSITNTASVTVGSPTGAVCAPSGSAPPCTSSASVPPPPPQVSFTKTANVASASPGGAVRYTLTLRNTGSVSANGTVVSDPQPAGVASMNWTCSASGATCPATSGSGALSQTIATLPPGAIVTYTVTASLSTSAVVGSTVTNTASATPPGGGTCAPGGTPGPCLASVGTAVSGAVQASNDAGVVAAGSSSTAVPNVLANDSSLGSSNPSIGSMTLTQLSSGNPGIVLNTGTGAVTVGASVPPGIYTLNYQVCDRAPTPNCATASVRITVTGSGGSGGVGGSGVAGIPTLGEWGFILLSGLLLGFGMRARRNTLN